MTPLLPIERARVFYDGLLTEPRLDHPEGIAVHPDGSVWCGGEEGQIYRIAGDGSGIEQVASTGGFCLGLAFAGERALYVCDLVHAAVFELDLASASVERFADGAGGQRIRIPNALALDAAGRLYVSDSHAFKQPGPGIFRFDADGSGALWYDGSLNFANGVALAPGEDALYVSETFANAIARIPIRPDGSPGEREEFARVPGCLPDGLAFGPDGALYVGCYEPSQVLRIDAEGNVACLVVDREAHLLCHPTNVAFRDGALLTSNLGRWHLTAIDLEQA